MSKKIVQSSLLSQIGFSENEQQVYLTILGIGNASLGEIALQTQLPLEEIQQIIQELTNRGYLKKIEGKINRYIAVEPFLKGFLFIEKEFQNDIINIENSLISSIDSNYSNLVKQMDEFRVAVEPIYNRIVEELRTSNEQLKMDLTNAIYRHSDKIANLAEDFDLLLTEGFSKAFLSISNELSNLSNEISIILREESDRATERLQKFEQLTNQTIQEMLAPIDNSIEHYKTTAANDLKTILTENKAEISALQKNVKSLTKYSIKEFATALKEFEKEFNAIITKATNDYAEVLTNYRTKMKEIFKLETGKIDGIVDNLIAEVGKNIDQLSIEASNLKENIDEISKVGRLKRPDPALVEEAKRRASKINELSQAIKTRYSEALNVYKKNIVEGITTLMKNSDATLSEQLKEGKTKIKNLKVKLTTKWSEISSKFEKDLNAATKDILKDASAKIATSSQQAFDVSLKNLETLKGNISEILLPFRDVVFNDLEDTLENLFLDSSKRLRLHNESNSKALETIRYLTDDMKFAFKTQVQEELSKPKMIASEMISQYTNSLDSYLTTLNRDQFNTLEKISKVIDSFLSNLKDALTETSSQISNRLAGIIYKVNETKTYLQEITNAVDQIIPVPRPHSLIIYGNQNSMAAIYDMLMRTKSTCTVVMPTIDQTFVDFLVKQISKTVRIRVLADIDPFRDESLISIMKEQGNITIWQYTMRDFYAVTRDGAEVLLAPVTREGELTSFLTEQDALVRAVQQIINASFMARSKEI
ncbi:MAG: helix-turn-helix domain-containing protein [Candidatus Heimdallarchaeota archaeon]